MKRLFCSSLICFMSLFSVLDNAKAADYPTKPITAYCMYGPGGVADLALRVFADYASRNGYNMNVVNMPGGSGAKAGLELLKSRPDGYKVLFATTALSQTAARKNLGFSIKDDFIPVAGLNMMYLSFCTDAKSDIMTMQDWIDKAIENPGTYTYSSPGAFSTQRIFMTNLFNKKFPGSMPKNVPFASGNEANSALLGGHVSAAMGVPGTNKPYIDSGDFRFLAVSSPERLEEYPDVPTFAELYGDEFVSGTYHIIYVHKDTPKEIIAQLETLVKNALADPEVAEKLNTMMFAPEFDTSEQAIQKVRDHYDYVVEVYKTLDL